jgi:hypothetical protein
LVRGNVESLPPSAALRYVSDVKVRVSTPFENGVEGHRYGKAHQAAVHLNKTSSACHDIQPRSQRDEQLMELEKHSFVSRFLIVQK